MSMELKDFAGFKNGDYIQVIMNSGAVYFGYFTAIDVRNNKDRLFVKHCTPTRRIDGVVYPQNPSKHKHKRSWSLDTISCVSVAQ